MFYKILNKNYKEAKAIDYRSNGERKINVYRKREQ